MIVDLTMFGLGLYVFVSGVTRGRGRTAPGDTLQGMTPEWNLKILWLNLERTVDKRRRRAIKVITLQTAMTKNGRQFFFRKKYGWHRHLPPRVTPTYSDANGICTVDDVSWRHMWYLIIEWFVLLCRSPYKIRGWTKEDRILITNLPIKKRVGVLESYGMSCQMSGYYLDDA